DDQDAERNPRTHRKGENAKRNGDKGGNSDHQASSFAGGAHFSTAMRRLSRFLKIRLIVPVMDCLFSLRDRSLQKKRARRKPTYFGTAAPKSRSICNRAQTPPLEPSRFGCDLGKSDRS